MEMRNVFYFYFFLPKIVKNLLCNKFESNNNDRSTLHYFENLKTQLYRYVKYKNFNSNRISNRMDMENIGFSLLYQKKKITISNM